MGNCVMPGVLTWAPLFFGLEELEFVVENCELYVRTCANECVCIIVHIVQALHRSWICMKFTSTRWLNVDTTTHGLTATPICGDLFFAEVLPRSDASQHIYFKLVSSGCMGGIQLPLVVKSTVLASRDVHRYASCFCVRLACCCCIP